MSAGDVLAAELRDEGVHCAVEARDGLAVLRLESHGVGGDGRHQQLADATARARIVRLARRHGFTHVAIELTDETDDGAPVRRR